MEGWLSLFFVAISTLLVGSWFLKLLGNKRTHKKKLPPGPWTLPIIGSLHHVISALPHRRLMEMSHRHGPLMHLRLGEVSTVIVSGAETAELVMKTHDLAFASRPRGPTQDIIGCGGRGIVFGPYGDRWRQMRKICIVELLSSKQVKRMEGIKAKEVGNLLRSIQWRSQNQTKTVQLLDQCYSTGSTSPKSAPGSITAATAPTTVNLSAMMDALSNDIVARAVFGGKFTQQDEYIRELDKVNHLIGGFSLVDLFPSSRLVRCLTNGEHQMKRSYGSIQRILAEIIEARKAARAVHEPARSTDDEDLLDVLLRLQEEESLAFPLTTEIIGVVIFDIFGAGTETTGTTLEWAMSELLRNPKAMAKAQLEVRGVLGQDRGVIMNTDVCELHYMKMVIKVFRLHPPAPLLVPRETREDCEIMGYDMPKGTNIFINAFAISRDPKYWDSPEQFIPERFDDNNVDFYGTHFQFTPFGAGRRQCPGMLFGTSTVEIAMANLLYHFDWVLPSGASADPLDMSERFGITVSRKSDLQLIAIPYSWSKAISI